MKQNFPSVILRLACTLGLASAVVVGACSSSSSAPGGCNDSPWQCGAGNTCWPSCVCPSGQTCTAANCKVTFACVPSQAGVVAGTSCELTNGKATCGDFQACVSFADGGGGGTCRTFCDKTGTCGADLACEGLIVAASTSAVEHVCIPPAIGLDGGLMIETGGGSSSGGGEGGLSDGGSGIDGNPMTL